MPSNKGVEIAAATFAARCLVCWPMLEPYLYAPVSAYDESMKGARPMLLSFGNTPSMIKATINE